MLLTIEERIRRFSLVGKPVSQWCLGHELIPTRHRHVTGRVCLCVCSSAESFGFSYTMHNLKLFIQRKGGATYTSGQNSNSKCKSRDVLVQVWPYQPSCQSHRYGHTWKWWRWQCTRWMGTCWKLNWNSHSHCRSGRVWLSGITASILQIQSSISIEPKLILAFLLKGFHTSMKRRVFQLSGVGTTEGGKEWYHNCDYIF